MPEPINTMKCPFRQNEHGEFMPCYGAECMAYLEYDQPALFLSMQCSGDQTPVRLTLCRRMAQPMPYGGGCA